MGTSNRTYCSHIIRQIFYATTFMSEKQNYTYHKFIGNQIVVCHGTIEEILEDTNQDERSHRSTSRTPPSFMADTNRSHMAREKNSSNTSRSTLPVNNSIMFSSSSEVEEIVEVKSESETSAVQQKSLKEDSEDCFITEVRKIPPPLITPTRKRRSVIRRPTKTPRTLLPTGNGGRKTISNTANCLFCGAEECHDKKYGSYCKQVCMQFMWMKKSSNIVRSTFFEVFQTTYSCVVNWELFKKSADRSNYSANRIIHVVPECMMNGSYTECLAKYCEGE
jgi:hypothetical protein